MIKNVIFDIGQVLAKFRWWEYIEDFGYSCEINDRLAKATVLSKYWCEIDRGLMPMDEIIELCVLLDQGIEKEIREFYKDTRKLVVEYDYASNWLRELKELGVHIYLLSNYGEINFSHVREVFTFFQYVEGAVISYQERCIKPEEKIYRILLDRYQLIPSECIFLDDLEANVKAAENLGIHSIQVINYQQAKEELNHKMKGMV